MAALLQPPTAVVEETKRIGRYSHVEGEILVLLRRPARFPPSLKEIWMELSPSFSESEIWKGILDLIQDGMIRAAILADTKSVSSGPRRIQSSKRLRNSNAT